MEKLFKETVFQKGNKYSHDFLLSYADKNGMTISEVFPKGKSLNAKYILSQTLLIIYDKIQKLMVTFVFNGYRLSGERKFLCIEIKNK